MAAKAFTQTNAALAGGDDQTTQWIFGWLILIVFLVVVGRTQSGRAIIYYSLVLIVVFLAVTQYQWIGQMLGQVSLVAPDQNGQSFGRVVKLGGNAPITTLSYDFSAGGLTIPGSATL